jgi:hypothetical protein
MTKGRKSLGYLSFLSPIQRGRGQILSLFLGTFLETLKSLLKTLFSAGE